MNIIFTVLAAFTIGFLVKQRAHAILTYLALEALLFSYQTLVVLLQWLGPEPGFEGTAFGPKPSSFPVISSSGEVIGYGIVNLVVVAAGVALTILGNRTAARRGQTRVVEHA